LSRAHGSDAPAQHRAYAPASVGCLVLTVSDTRTPDDDSSGKLCAERLEAAGHRPLERAIVKDEREAIRAAVLRGIARPDIDVVIATGGTGVSPRDSTPEAVEPLLDKVLHGFGELFRALSFQVIGPAALLSRALAGTAQRTAVLVVPGSSAAVRLALDRLILPELAHLVGQLRR
jgi:molybdenum cofactor biosynthesis protein B